MYIDAQCLLSSAQAVTAAANSTNVYDLGVTRNIGAGEDLYIFTKVDVAMTDTGSDSTIAVTLVTDDNASLSSTATIQTLYTFPATSAVGTMYVTKLPTKTNVPYERYIAVAYTPANGNLTTGSFTTGIVSGKQFNQLFASGYTIN